MAFLEKNKSPGVCPDTGVPLYRALVSGDLPAACLLAAPLLEQAKSENLPAPTAFNCGLYLYQLGEYEKALAPLKQAEQALGVPPDLGTQDKRLFLQALKTSGQVFLLPLDPQSGRGSERYFLIRVRWLAALCLLQLKRRQEAAPAIRFLAQYHIEL